MFKTKKILIFLLMLVIILSNIANVLALSADSIKVNETPQYFNGSK